MYGAATGEFLAGRGPRQVNRSRLHPPRRPPRVRLPRRRPRGGAVHARVPRPDAIRGRVDARVFRSRGAVVAAPAARGETRGGPLHPRRPFGPARHRARRLRRVGETAGGVEGRENEATGRRRGAANDRLAAPPHPPASPVRSVLAPRLGLTLRPVQTAYRSAVPRPPLSSSSASPG